MANLGAAHRFTTVSVISRHEFDGKVPTMATNADLERVAETHFMIRPTLLRALEGIRISQEGAAILTTPAGNYREL